ncbi:MAG TPA: exopolysaccharide biosynthesis polyprenyl glycosylphosphotransferase [Stellaceae bacterium]|nr:exopolysaccharide biosynthesis polyprenyl glycosylphosphotransferase [Stellaceae bacterium]
MFRVLSQVLPREVILVAASEMLFSAIGIYLALHVTAEIGISPTNLITGQLNLVIILILGFTITASVLGLYRSETIFDFNNLVAKSIVAALLALLATMLLPAALYQHSSSLSAPIGDPLIAVALSWLGCLAATQLAFFVVRQRQLLARRIVIVALPGEGARFRRFVAAGRCRPFEDIRLLEPASDGGGEGCAARFAPEALRRARIWGVVVAEGSDRALPASALLDLRLRGVRVLTEAAFWEREGCWIDVDGADLSWVFDRYGFRHGRVAEAAKRLLDLAVASGLIVATLPVMLLTAILIKLESAGPVLYCQERVGRHGRTFVLYKFRSMRRDAETPGAPQWAAVGDPRVTAIGRFIRCTRIDELPQLFNVLRGEMSVVGPRPERPFFVDQFVHSIPFYAQRHCAKPGITGWAQVSAPYGASLEEARDKLRYDLYYVKNRSFLLDLWILACTVRTVLLRQGAR